MSNVGRFKPRWRCGRISTPAGRVDARLDGEPLAPPKRLFVRRAVGLYEDTAPAKGKKTMLELSQDTEALVAVLMRAALKLDLYIRALYAAIEGEGRVYGKHRLYDTRQRAKKQAARTPLCADGRRRWERGPTTPSSPQVIRISNKIDDKRWERNCLLRFVQLVRAGRLVLVVHPMDGGVPPRPLKPSLPEFYRDRIVDLRGEGVVDLRFLTPQALQVRFKLSGEVWFPPGGLPLGCCVKGARVRDAYFELTEGRPGVVVPTALLKQKLGTTWVNGKNPQRKQPGFKNPNGNSIRRSRRRAKFQETVSSRWGEHAELLCELAAHAARAPINPEAEPSRPPAPHIGTPEASTEGKQPDTSESTRAETPGQ